MINNKGKEGGRTYYYHYYLDHFTECLSRFALSQGANKKIKGIFSWIIRVLKKVISLHVIDVVNSAKTKQADLVTPNWGREDKNNTKFA